MYSMREMGEVLLDANHHLKLKASHVQSRRRLFQGLAGSLIAASDVVL